MPVTFLYKLIMKRLLRGCRNCFLVKKRIWWVFSRRAQVLLLPGILWALLGRGDRRGPEQMGGT